MGLLDQSHRRAFAPQNSPLAASPDPPDARSSDGAGDGIRTRDIQLGRLELYQLSYARPAPASRALAPRARRLVGREGFEPSKAVGRQIYSLMRLTASLPPRPAAAPTSSAWARAPVRRLRRWRLELAEGIEPPTR